MNPDPVLAAATQAAGHAVASQQALGFGHFIAQSDPVGKTLLVILVGMSVMSWVIVAVKGLSLLLRQRRSDSFLHFFWNATSLDAVSHEISTHGVHDPFSHLTSHAMHAQAHHAKYGAAKLEEAGTSGDFVTRTIKKVLDEEPRALKTALLCWQRSARPRPLSACSARSGACITRWWPSA